MEIGGEALKNLQSEAPLLFGTKGYFTSLASIARVIMIKDLIQKNNSALAGKFHVFCKHKGFRDSP